MTPAEIEERVVQIRKMRMAGARDEVLHLLTLRLMVHVVTVMSASRATTGHMRRCCKAALKVLEPLYKPAA